MSANTTGHSCPYREVVASMDAGEAIRNGYDRFAFDRSGTMIEGRRLWPGKPWRVIAVNREFYRPISDATARLKERVGPVLFTTREPVEFEVQLRIGTSRERTREIARCHFDDTMGPEQLFYSVFADRFRKRLEDSARSDPDDIDTRIARNRKTWETELAAELSARFGVTVELHFVVKNTVPTDRVIASDPAAPPLVTFRDRIDRQVPIAFNLRIARDPALRAANALPGDETRLRDNIAAVIRQAASQDLNLFDYWYRPERMAKVLTPRIAAFLEGFGFTVTNLVVSRAETAAPPAAAIKLDDRISWQDTHGYPLEFRAQAVAEIHPERAGLYDRAGCPDRAAWFKRAFVSCLNRVLAGRGINDFSSETDERWKAEIETCVSIQAEAIGLDIKLFVATPLLPLQDWLVPRNVMVPADEPYPTAHPTIHGDFSMDMGVRFQSRRAFDAFFQEFARGESGSNARVPDNAFVEGRLIVTAREAARLVMQTTPAETYFSTYIGEGRWNSPISQHDLPGHATEGGAKGNRIEAKLRDILSKRYPGVLLESLDFHRRDTHLESLRKTVSALRPVTFVCDLVDHHNAGLDRELTVYLTIADGDATQIVMMLTKGFQNFTPEEFSRRIAHHLRTIVPNRLAKIGFAEMEALAASLTEAGRQYTSDIRERIINVVRTALLAEFGLNASTIELTLGLSSETDLVRTGNKALRAGAAERFYKELMSLEKELDQHFKDREAITDTSPEAQRDRRIITDRIAERKREIAALKETAGQSGLAAPPYGAGLPGEDRQSGALPPPPRQARLSDETSERRDPERERRSEDRWNEEY